MRRLPICRTLARVMSIAGLLAGGFFGTSQRAAGQAAPAITSQPQSLTVRAGTNVAFAVTASGQSPLVYQWYFGGSPLSNGPRISGATAATLQISNVFAGDAGNYFVTVTNNKGALTSAVATLTVLVPPVITSQPASLVRAIGGSANFSVSAAGTTPLSYRWRKEGAPLSDGADIQGSATSALELTNLTTSTAGAYSVVVSNVAGSVTSSVAVLTINAVTVDEGFNPGADIVVYSTAVQPDGKILAAGYFFLLGGQGRYRIGRLNADGTVDPAFNPGADSYVNVVATQPDGKILAGGQYTSIAGQPRNRIARLNPDGTLDATFNSSANEAVYALALQPDGKILVGGRFTSLAGVARNALGRLNADGTLDAAFNPGVVGQVQTLALQPDGKILIAGDIGSVGGQPRSNIARLNSDGTLDAGFTAEANFVTDCLTIQADGKILLGGRFWEVDGQPRGRLARVFPDGTLDQGFDAGADSDVNSLAVQTDGKILVAGNFGTLGGQLRRYLGRLHPDGAVDASFDPGADGYVYSVGIQADGKSLVGGSFGTVGGLPRAAIARLNNTAAATQSLSFDGTNITWLRSGSGPELARTYFESSADNTNWTSLGPGARVAGGWQSTNVSLAPGSFFRARGHFSSGFRNGSENSVEAKVGPPFVLSQPSSLTTNFGANVALIVEVEANLPASYRWQKDGGDLADGGRISGATTATLQISAVRAVDAGQYRVRITNSYSTTTSAVATLAVVQPIITAPPSNRIAALHDQVTLIVTADGDAPLAYQWRRNGIALANDAFLSGVTSPALFFADVQPEHDGSYDVVVTNSYGVVTSAVAILDVRLEPLILSQPTTQYVFPGSNAVFTVTADGAVPLAYQWFFSGVALTNNSQFSGADSPVLTIQNIHAGNAGGYQVVVSNVWGSITSSVASLGLRLVRYVNVNNPTPAAPYTNWATAATVIQDAINVSGIGDVILVTNGVYSSGSVPGSTQQYYASHRVALDKPLSVISVNGPAVTTITGGGSSFGRRCAYLTNGAMLAGFTLSGGRADLGNTSTLNQRGAGVLCQSLSSIVSNCIITGNVAGRSGGGAYSGTLINCTIANNTCRDVGGARTGDGGGTYQSTLVNCVVANNSARYGGGGTMLGNATNCLLRGNSATWGGGAYITTLVNCTVVGNASVDDGGLGGASGGGMASGTAINSIIMFNSGGYGGPNYWGGSRLYSCTSPPSSGEGNISVDPLFVDAANGNYRLQTNSPCRNAGTNVAMTLSADLDGRARVVDGIVDMGAFEFQHLPWIVTGPQSQSVVVGGNAVFTLTTIGDEPFTYEWRKNGVVLSDGGNISGANTATLTLSNVTLADAGGYQAVIANALGAATSSVATLTILFPPMITAPPTNQAVAIGATASAAVGAIGTAPLSYQWRLNGSNLPAGAKFSGTTTTLLTISGFSTNEAGNYDVVIANTYGSVTSAVAVISALPLAITNQPVSRTVPAGTNVNFSVGVSGTAAFGYQWRFNQIDLPGRTNATLTLTNVQAANAGGYDVVVTNLYAALTSSVATLAVIPAAPAILTQPVSRVVSVGQSVALAVTLIGSEPMQCQWQRNGTNVPGANSPVLVLDNVNSSVAGSYRASLTNALGYAISTNATLTVSPVLVWGQTNAGQGTINANPPAAASNVIAIAAGGGANLVMPCMALRANGTLVLWGDASRLTGPPTNAVDVVAIAMGVPTGTQNYVVLRANGTVVNWTSSEKLLPASLTNGNVVAIAAGASHQLGLRDDGTVVAWGSNTSGQTNVPASATNVIAIAAGQNHNLALRWDGTVVGWGLNTSGQATALSNAVNVAVVVAGGNQSLALLSDGTAIGSIVTNTPSAGGTFYGPPTGNVSNKLSLAAGQNHSLALGWNRTISAWGSTNYDLQNIPAYATNVLAVAAGTYHNLALVRDAFAPPIPPRIGRPPLGRTVMAGQPAVFNALAIGGLPLAHQWLRNGVPIPGQTRPSLIFTNVLPPDAGDYQLVALNEFGSTTSAVATVTVTIPQPLLQSSGVVSNGFRFTFKSIAGVIYVVEFKNDLNAPAWTELERRFGVGGIEIVTDATAGGVMRLYRVRAVYAPPPGLSFGIGSGNAVNFHFPTVAGANYIVQYKTNLNQFGWLELSRQTGNGTPIVIIDPTTNGPSRFYRVKVE